MAKKHFFEFWDESGDKLAFELHNRETRIVFPDRVARDTGVTSCFIDRGIFENICAACAADVKEIGATWPICQQRVGQMLWSSCSLQEQGLIFQFTWNGHDGTGQEFHDGLVIKLTWDQLACLPMIRSRQSSYSIATPVFGL